MELPRFSGRFISCDSVGRKVEEGEHSIPVSIKGFNCLRELALVSCDELLAELPGICKGVGVGD